MSERVHDCKVTVRNGPWKVWRSDTIGWAISKRGYPRGQFSFVVHVSYCPWCGESLYPEKLDARDTLAVEVARLKGQLVKVGQGLMDDVVESCADQERQRLIAEVAELKDDMQAAHTACGSCRQDSGRVYAFCPCCGQEN